MSADNILGTWHGSKNIPFLASGKCVITFHEDNTARASGKVHALGKDFNVDETITWKNIGGGNYIGSYGDYQLGFSMNPEGTQVQTVFNAYKLGLMSSSVYNQDITITLYR